MELPVLFKKTKTGAIQSWQVSTNGSEIITKSGQVLGIKTTSKKNAKPKNIGRTNETTPEKQAEMEALSMWKKRLDKDYFETAEEAARNTVLLPMLASDFKKRADKIAYPVSIQPKLDGVRCLAHWQGEKVVLLSRGGKTYELPHISKEISKILPKVRILDGEIYIHGCTFQHITKLVKKYRPGETEKLAFWAYDIFSVAGAREIPWKDRVEELSRVLVNDTSGILYECPTFEATNQEQVLNYEKKFVSRGFEGAIVRENNAGYEIAHRSNHLLKVKSFKDEEFPIVGFTGGVGSYKECVIWRCVARNGNIFNVVPKGTLEEKRKWYKNANEHVGKMLKVKYFELTEDDVPRFPVGLGMRLPEDM